MAKRVLLEISEGQTKTVRFAPNEEILDEWFDASIDVETNSKDFNKAKEFRKLEFELAGKCVNLSAEEWKDLDLHEKNKIVMLMRDEMRGTGSQEKKID